MSWITPGSDERLMRAMRSRREVQRGPLSEEGSVDVDEVLGTARAAAHAFATNLVFLFIIVMILVAATFYYALYSGALRWLLFAAVVAGLGFVAVRFVGGFTRDPPNLAASGEGPSGGTGDLTRLRQTLIRADSGLAYSQLLFEERLRRSFLEKVAASRGLRPLDVERIAEDPDRLHDLLGDRELTVFVLECARNARMYPASLPTLPKRRRFGRRVALLLDRMEAWQ